MTDILKLLGDKVMGVISGFDRLLFRGLLRCVINPRGLNGYLYRAKVAMTDFEAHAQQVSQRLIEESLREPRATGCEIRYLPGSRDRKKDIALEIARRDGIREGRICVLTCVEPCISFRVRRDRATKTIALERRPRKCLHVYHYFEHPTFGLMHVRLQTWFPFSLQVCLNGREWLAKQLRTAGLDYDKRDNCICGVQDFDAAQKLCDQQLCTAWPSVLDELRRVVHPAHEAIFANCPESARGYYWTLAESEWASDILFHQAADVLPLAERLAAHTLRVHGVGDVLRFLGKTVCKDGLPRATFGGQVRSDSLRFEQGIRVKYAVNGNSAKFYNHPLVLRLETTVNRPEEFKVYRTRETDPDAAPTWLPMRRGVADIHRRAEVSQATNDRLATALAQALSEDATPLKELAAALCARVTRPGKEQADGTRSRSRTYRGLNPLAADDLKLLAEVAQPQYAISGLRNQQLRLALFGSDPTDPKEKRRRSSATSRKLALLRAHGLVEKVSKSHQYRVTSKGRQALTALLAAANATTSELNKLAA
jgi:hypothetical protein